MLNRRRPLVLLLRFFDVSFRSFFSASFCRRLALVKPKKAKKKKKLQNIFFIDFLFYPAFLNAAEGEQTPPSLYDDVGLFVRRGFFSIRVLEGFARLIVVTLFFFPPRSQRKIENTPKTSRPCDQIKTPFRSPARGSIEHDWNRSTLPACRCAVSAARMLSFDLYSRRPRTSCWPPDNYPNHSSTLQLPKYHSHDL